jgi:predicted phosphodiesterase
MKYGIISDIHSNIQAYKKAVSILEKSVDVIVCLGDIVGYNANPKECIEFTQKHEKIKYVLKGNHDELAHTGLRISNTRNISHDAFDGIKHTVDSIDKEDIEWLYNLEDNVFVQDKDFPFLAVHGTPLRGKKYSYILHQYRAAECAKELVDLFEVNLCFFGHTHVPTFFEVKTSDLEESLMPREMVFHIGKGVIEDPLVSNTYDVSDPDKTYLINPGAIGQPRSYGMHSFVIFDSVSKEIHFECFDYNREEAIKAINDAGYSKHIALRLQKDY